MYSSLEMELEAIGDHYGISVQVLTMVLCRFSQTKVGGCHSCQGGPEGSISSGQISLGNLREDPRLSGNLGMQFPGPQLGCCLAHPEGRARWLPACR